MSRYKSFLNHNPQALIVHSFFVAIALGAFLLTLPIATVSREPLRWIDAAFMATSATCVTGLSVVNVGGDLTLFGQLVILFLIQLGGLGIMTFSLLFLTMLGRRLSLSSAGCVSVLTDNTGIQAIRRIITKIFLMTIAIELVGALMLFFPFSRAQTIPQAIYSSVFHAISAFCNAGFGLHSDSLMRYQLSAYVQLTVMGLIVLGGLGFAVIEEAWSVLTGCNRRSLRTLSLHSKIALLGTAFLILSGMLIIWIFEHDKSLSPFTAGQQFLNAAFLSVTSRTAGFNTIDTGFLSNATLLFVICLMFIGACPGSTGGGVKVSTFSVLVAFFVSRLKGYGMTNIFKRKIPDDVVSRAVIIFSLSFFAVFGTIFFLQISEHQLSALIGGKNFLNLMFEAVSAFGTVGLSTGITAHLSDVGKAILIALMFIGRIGPLTLAIALQVRARRHLGIEYPQEEILVG